MSPIRLATGANRPLWQPSDLLRYGWGGWIRTNVDLLQRQGPHRSATPQCLVHGDGFEPSRPMGILGYNQTPSTARPTMHVSLVSIEDSIETAIEMNDSLRTARTANVSSGPEGFVYYSQIVREHVSTAFCRAQSGAAIADAKILVGFEGVEPSRLAAPVSETGAYANSARSPICSLPTFTRRATKNPGRLRDNPGFCSSSDTARFRCSISQVLPLATHSVPAAHFSSSRRKSFRRQSLWSDRVDATAILRTYRLLTAARSKSKVAVSMSASASLQDCTGRQGDDSLTACGKRTQATFLLRRWSICGFWNCDPVDLRLAPGGVNRQVSQRDECRLRRSERADG
jgi:hypothetical protein